MASYSIVVQLVVYCYIFYMLMDYPATDTDGLFSYRGFILIVGLGLKFYVVSCKIIWANSFFLYFVSLICLHRGENVSDKVAAGSHLGRC